MTNSEINRPRVALFEPRIPQNTGTIGRSCLAFKLSLDIIKPTGFSFEDKYLKRAGLDYWSNVDVNLYESFEEYISIFKNSRIIALTKKSNNLISDIKHLSIPGGDYLRRPIYTSAIAYYKINLSSIENLGIYE